MDPTPSSHQNPTRSAVEVERAETERAMLQLIHASAKEPAKAKQQVLAFFDDLKRRMNEQDAKKRITSA